MFGADRIQQKPQSRGPKSKHGNQSLLLPQGRGEGLGAGSVSLHCFARSGFVNVSRRLVVNLAACTAEDES